MGGQGTVYKATDTKLGRTVVVKSSAAGIDCQGSEPQNAFEREARLASSLDHPNICTIFDLDEIEGVHFIAMQYVEGKNVRQLVGGHPLEFEERFADCHPGCRCTRGGARTRHHPSRRQIGKTSWSPLRVRLKILDFGLAKLLDDDEASATGIHRTELTEVGVPYGTATYAAPNKPAATALTNARTSSRRACCVRNGSRHLPFRGKSTIDRATRSVI